jgi:hypothetical protein
MDEDIDFPLHHNSNLSMHGGTDSLIGQNQPDLGGAFIAEIMGAEEIKVSPEITGH